MRASLQQKLETCTKEAASCSTLPEVATTFIFSADSSKLVNFANVGSLSIQGSLFVFFVLTVARKTATKVPSSSLPTYVGVSQKQLHR